MRLFLTLLLLPMFSAQLLSLPAHAADPAKPAAHHARLTWQQHFAQANPSHDGHLTLEQAKAGYPLLAKHFDDIDADHKGYVTENDVRAWRVIRKASHRLVQPHDDRLKPQNAMQLGPMQHKPINASTTRTVPLPPDRAADQK